MARLSLALALLLGCGVDVVELSAQGDVLVIGAVPAEAIAGFSGAGMPDPKMLTLRYPELGSVLPENLAPLEFSWPSMKDRVYELRLSAADRELRVYTVEGAVTLPLERWRSLLSADSLQVQLSALDGKGMLKRGAAQPLAIHPALEGTLYLDGAASAAVSDANTSPGTPPQPLRVARSRLELGDGTTLQAPEGARLAHPRAFGSTIVFTYWPPELNLADDKSDAHEGSQLARFSDGVFETLSIDRMNPRRPSLSPDGAWLAFEAGKLEGPELFVAPLAGGPSKRVSCDMPKGGAPEWLAQDWLAFIATRPQRAQVWLTQLQLPEATCTPPIWLPAQDPARDYESIVFVP